MQNRHASIVSGLFGVPGQVEVERGLAEFRGGRPLVIRDGEQALLALPVDGIDAARLAAFRTLCGTAMPKLIITKRRARALGIEAATPMALTLRDHDDVGRLFSLAA